MRRLGQCPPGRPQGRLQYAAVLALSVDGCRMSMMSRCGDAPNRRLWSRLNCEALSVLQWAHASEVAEGQPEGGRAPVHARGEPVHQHVVHADLNTGRDRAFDQGGGGGGEERSGAVCGGAGCGEQGPGWSAWGRGCHTSVKAQACALGQPQFRVGSSSSASEMTCPSCSSESTVPPNGTLAGRSATGLHAGHSK